MKIPFAKANIGEEEIKAVEGVLRSGWLTQGTKVQEFEEKFAEYVGAKYAIAVNSATSALFLCLRYLKEQNKKGKYVIAPSLTFSASASTAIHNNLSVVFSDVTDINYCLNDSKLNNSLEKNPGKVLGVVSVHLTGNKSLMGLKDFNVPIIEDSAHRILPKTQGNNPVCYSFYATKNMTTGEGGMITTNNEAMAAWFKMARLHGCDKDGFKRYKEGSGWKYEIKFCGWKMNMTDIMAAIGIEQLKKLPEMNNQRQRCVDRYNKAFGLNRTGLHLYPIRVNNREKFMDLMKYEEIGCSVHFLPLHKMPAYKKCKCLDDMKVTETLGEQFVSLPLYPTLKDEEIDYVCEKVLKTGLLINK